MRLPPDVPVLPAPLTALLGRERELGEVESLLARPSVRLVTLLGSGGIGKSRLAVEVASRARARGDAEVAPRARGDERPGMLHIPGGEHAYRLLARAHTSLDTDPEEIHAIGLA